jgi:hypothetical protein
MSELPFIFIGLNVEMHLGKGQLPYYHLLMISELEFLGLYSLGLICPGDDKIIGAAYEINEYTELGIFLEITDKFRDLPSVQVKGFDFIPTGGTIVIPADNWLVRSYTSDIPGYF